MTDKKYVTLYLNMKKDQHEKLVKLEEKKMQKSGKKSAKILQKTCKNPAKILQKKKVRVLSAPHGAVYL